MGGKIICYVGSGPKRDGKAGEEMPSGSTRIPGEDTAGIRLPGLPCSTRVWGKGPNLWDRSPHNSTVGWWTCSVELCTSRGTDRWVGCGPPRSRTRVTNCHPVAAPQPLHTRRLTHAHFSVRSCATSPTMISSLCQANSCLCQEVFPATPAHPELSHP